MSDRQLLKIEEIAQKLRCSKSWIYQSVALRKIPFTKLGGMLLFDESVIDEWIRKNTYAPENA
ncbi:MAG: helix-turn-helix domain-containing protein [Candidatus Omnitrophota bacterium]|jgi:excisionase family DNA binding protein